MKSVGKFSWLHYSSHEVMVGDIGFGGNNPVRLQSMTNTATADVEATVRQSKLIFDAGADLVRITARNIAEAVCLSDIRKELNSDGYSKPLSADIHFNPAIAVEAARRVEKIRINPGNFVNLFPGKLSFSNEEYKNELDEIHKITTPLIAVCREYGTSVRIGINGGSLSKRIIDRYGNTPQAMVESALEFIDIFRSDNFHKLVVSIKASEVLATIHANRLLAQAFVEKGYSYPIHLGVTEAGEGEDGRIKSAAGIGVLLIDGVGDTIRVSLTESPEKEIPVAQKIVASALKNRSQKDVARRFYEKVFPFKHYLNEAEKASNEKPVTGNRSRLPEVPLQIDLLRSNFEQSYNKPMAIVWEPELQSVIDFAIVAGSFFADGCGNAIRVDTKNDATSYYETALSLLQTTGRLITKAAFTSCPSCGRTTFDIEKILKQVKEQFASFTGVQFAVMGCIVNGPGEMEGARYGILGSKPNHVDIYFNGQPVLKGIHQDKAVAELKKLVDENEKK
ncbi:MAG: 4-hydroxy-3-methylbut-2-en-1-yl diphosphate synthase [Bacteroidetes bacterium HGW-Bacteroidetes-6]|jgi:(E)-4-hydroxy-3-methylbut-2-enyl-diphosphate synthase|nr:MAG: 4-hydroxy-3-methylbut-2-en-1-yl diphosphate synthase [Bacteroidetes bacterium HGW-Bacteroidetes-6]